MIEWLHFHFSLSCIGEGNGNPLQCSCLDNPRDGGAWWAVISGVAKSWTWLKRLSSNSCYIREAYLSGFLIKIAFFFPFLFCMAPSALEPGLRRRLPPFLNFLNSFYQLLFPRKTPTAFQSFFRSFRRWSLLRTGTSGTPGNLLCHISPQMLMLCSFTAQFTAVLSQDLSSLSVDRCHQVMYGTFHDQGHTCV